VLLVLLPQFRDCSFGEYPLSFAAAVGERKICGKLLGAYGERNKAEEWRKQHDDKALHDDYQDSLKLDFLNKQSVHGDTALHIAVRYGRQNVMDWLIDAGANGSMQVQNSLSLR